MLENRSGLSPELIIHPGETLKEIIEERDISQKELAVRTGNSPKHISDVVNCLKPISVKFAKKLEYALGIDSSFWINLQGNYDREMAGLEELNHITESEIQTVGKLKDIIHHLVEYGFLQKTSDSVLNVISLRRLLRISSIDAIPVIAKTGAFRIAQHSKVDPYVMFAWLRMSELFTERIELDKLVDVDYLINSIDKIKSQMFEPPQQWLDKLSEIFAQCGIKFVVVKHFKGAPVQGLITRNSDGSLSVIMTIRHAQADIFWFALMHEVAHIINGDIRKRLIDYDNGPDNPQEIRANELAGQMLLDESSYRQFVDQKAYDDLNLIKKFAAKNSVKPYIVIGRLQKEKLIPYSTYSSEKEYYHWT